jgi:hypothetical protein
MLDLIAEQRCCEAGEPGECDPLPRAIEPPHAGRPMNAMRSARGAGQADGEGATGVSSSHPPSSLVCAPW